MHELSLALSIVDAVNESAAAYPGARVEQVRLRIGVLSAVEQDALRFCWEIATEGSALAGSELAVTMLPVVVWCAGCNFLSEIEGLQNLRCRRCGEPAGDVRQGYELEIESIEIEERGTATPVSNDPAIREPEASRPERARERV